MNDAVLLDSVASVADHPRSQVVQNERNVMSEAVIFVSSFTDPGASQWLHFAGMVRVKGFGDASMVTRLLAPNDVLRDCGVHVLVQRARGMTAFGCTTSIAPTVDVKGTSASSRVADISRQGHQGGGL